MKVNKLAVIVSNKKGDCYQVALTKTEEKLIQSLISQLHGGKINAVEELLPLEIKKK